MPIDFYEPEEVMALSRAASTGGHRDPRRPAVTAEEQAERARADEQDAALFVVAAFTGLRLGELLAPRWRNVHFSDAKLLVEASWSAGRLSTPKSRKWRAVPLADQPAGVLARLAQRERFFGRDDLVFCSAAGTYLDPPAVRRRYRRAQSAAGLRPLRFHDLRHSFGSLVIREFDPVAVKDFMGHSKITTTERYLHARARRTDALRLTKALGAEDDRAPVPHAAVTPDWEQTLDGARGARVRVEFIKDRREISDYSVVLTMEHDGHQVTVRVYDGAHGVAKACAQRSPRAYTDSTR